MIENQNELWQAFAARFALTQEQIKQFQCYYTMLVAANQHYNLTALTELSDVISYHFADSLALNTLVDCTTLHSIADIGTGAGFPGIPLKIVYPQLHVILIEVVHKKISFLQTVIQELCLTNVTLVDSDWRTFLRKTTYQVDLFCARASLQPAELIRLFKPSSAYKHTSLVYWASQHWEPLAQEAIFIKQEKSYTIDTKQRKLVMFKH